MRARAFALEVRFASDCNQRQVMKIIGVAKLPNRRAWLEEVARDLAHRTERRIAEFGAAWHASNPLYQRLWSALTRVRRELSQVEDTVALRRERAGESERGRADETPTPQWASLT
jgi:hypothetical protein